MLIASLYFSQYRSNSKVKVTGFKMLVLTERSSPKEYLCEISKLWHSLLEVISKVQVSGHRQNYRDKKLWKERMTRPKKHTPLPILI